MHRVTRVSPFFQVKGFQLEYLVKVPEVKDTVHKHSLLHHLCHMVMEKFPDSTDLYSEVRDCFSWKLRKLYVSSRCRNSATVFTKLWQSLFVHVRKTFSKGVVISFCPAIICVARSSFESMRYYFFLNRFRNSINFDWFCVKSFDCYNVRVFYWIFLLYFVNFYTGYGY